MKRPLAAAIGICIVVLILIVWRPAREGASPDQPAAPSTRAVVLEDRKPSKGIREAVRPTQPRPGPSDGSDARADDPGGRQDQLSAPEKGARPASHSLLQRADRAWRDVATTSTVPPERFPIDRAGIRGAVRAATPEMKECYEGWLRQNPKIEGRLQIGFTIAEDEDEPGSGKVVEVRLEETDVGHVLMESCILSVFSGLRFEAPEEPVKVTYPVMFSNEEKQ